MGKNVEGVVCLKGKCCICLTRPDGSSIVQLIVGNNSALPLGIAKRAESKEMRLSPPSMAGLELAEGSGLLFCALHLLPSPHIQSLVKFAQLLIVTASHKIPEPCNG